MGKKTTNEKLQRKLNSIRHQYNCIPVKVNANDPGEYNGIDEYRDFRPETKHISIKDRPGKGKKLNKQKPWYYLTKAESIAIMSDYKSAKMTHEDYIEGYLEQKLEKWEQTHKKPDEKDIFYKEEYPKWVSERESVHDKIVAQLSKKYIKQYTHLLIHHVLESKFKESKTVYSKAA